MSNFFTPPAINASPPPATNSAYVNLHNERKIKLDELKAMDPVDFEKFVGSLFERMGFAVRTTPHSGDEGIDLWIEKNGEKSIVQCKRYGPTPVGQPILRDLYGEMIHCQVNRAYLVTTGLFSLPAQTWAEDKAVVLVDGAQLCDWIGYVMPPPLPVKIDPAIAFAARLENKKRIKANLVQLLCVIWTIGFCSLLVLAVINLPRFLDWVILIIS